jgi:lipopolysaccharide/colanic/teichoic acid biosynthesis glycosyltransferase
VRPGITDEASIEFRDEGDLLAGADDPEALYVSEIMPRKLDIYASYARKHTFAGDLRILWRTAQRVLRFERSYPSG